MGGDDTATKPKKTFKEKSRENCAAFSKFMWDSEHRTCMGRTGISWLKVLTFYLGFYIALTALWAICMAVFLQTLDGYAPTQQHKYSMLKDNPGMGFWSSTTNQDTVIYFSTENASTWEVYTNQINQTLTTQIQSKQMAYSNQTGLKNCTWGNGADINNGCYFDMALAGLGCTAENNFGYSIGKPCVMLRINKVYNWDPKANGWLFDGSNTTNEYQFSQIPSNMKSLNDSNHIPVSCTGENDGDMDNIININFYPPQGFPVYFFPYLNQPTGYMPPFVMAQFETVPGRALMIWCRYWTKTVQHDLVDLQGSIHFEMFLMNNLYNNSQYW